MGGRPLFALNHVAWPREELPLSLLDVDSTREYLRARIPGATVHEVDAGHASCVLQSDKFVPALLEALACTFARARDMAA